MEKVFLDASVRELAGKGACSRLRRERIIPGVVYGAKTENINIKVESGALWHVLHTTAGENVIITMKVSDGLKKSGKAEKTVIVKDIQHDPINDKVVHVDFQEISLTEKLKVKVPVSVKGEAVGVREEEGILTQEMWEIELECMPTNIPGHIDVNVENLRINDAVHVKDLPVPEGVVFLEDPEHVVVSVSPPQAEEELVPEVAPEEGEEPEVIKKGKKEEEEEPSEEVAAEKKPAEKKPAEKKPASEPK